MASRIMRQHRMKHHELHRLRNPLLVNACMLGVVGSAVIGVVAQENSGHKGAAENIALGKVATFSAPPSYALSNDEDDAKQITDGIYSSDAEPGVGEDRVSIWMRKSSVGWTGVHPVITIDLGKVQPISGVSYSTAGGRADVNWPENIFVAVSDDNKKWHYAGDLAALSETKPPAEGPAAIRYNTHSLRTRGRFVAFAVVNGPYSFVDEIEVYRGDEAWLQEPVQGKSVPNVQTFLQEAAVAAKVRLRLNNDIAGIRAELGKVALPAARKSELVARLAALESQVKGIAQAPADLKTILPLNDTHRKILAVHGELLAAQGHKPLTLWKTPRYAWLPLLAVPGKATTPVVLDFSMLRNQHRSDAFLLTNSARTPMTVSLKLTNPPRAAQAKWLEIYSTIWTDSYGSLPVADALLPITARNGAYQVDIPAGMTRKIWFTVDSSKLPAGDTRSALEVRSGSTVQTIPLRTTIGKIAMPKPRLSMSVWDYTNGNGSSAITPRNRDAAIKLMRSHHIDTPWATGWVLPRPAGTDFDAEGKLTKELDFKQLDEWIARWPGAKSYFVFAAVNDTFADAKINTPEFEQRVGVWAKTLAAHVKKLGLRPQQLGMLLVDEPHKDEQDVIIAAWAKAINASAPELTLFSDPIWERPDLLKNQDAFTQVDILSPLLPFYKKGGEPVAKYFESLRQQGKALWLYQCDGPSRSFAPQRYYRANAWHAFSMGAVGQGFWAFGDTSNAPTSWQSYLATTVGYEQAFIDTDTVHTSVHWESVREGVEDYEELAMLRDAIAASKNPALKTQAQAVLNSAVSTVTGMWSKGYVWKEETDGGLTDRQLAKVRKMLLQFHS
jgi:hypothetical protein